jgi:hypothetical protein
MQRFETRSTSRRTAECDSIVLREGNQVRLVFVPTLVDNAESPRASVDGYFIYQRKAKSGRWVPVRTVSLSTLKSGEGFKLELHAQELLTLLERLVPLYKFYEQKGIPKGRKTFVEVAPPVAEFVSRSKTDLAKLLTSDPDEAPTLLLQFMKWLASNPGTEAARKLTAIAPEQMPNLTALLGVATLKNALAYWKANASNDSEKFWQKAIEERAFVLSQIFAYPVVFFGAKAYVGGKQISGKGGKEADFLLAIESTDAIILIEIKTPQTRLLGRAYREGVFPLSQDLSGAISQVLRYRQSLTRKFDSITAELAERPTLGEPRCIVIAGNSQELVGQSMRENFELARERIHGVTIITYDELFRRLEQLVGLLEMR